MSHLIQNIKRINANYDLILSVFSGPLLNYIFFKLILSLIICNQSFSMDYFNDAGPGRIWSDSLKL